MEEFKNKSHIGGYYKRPKFEVVKFDYSDVITASACDADVCECDGEDRHGCPENV